MSLSGGVDALSARVAQEFNTLRQEQQAGRVQVYSSSFDANDVDHVITHNLGTRAVIVQTFWNEAPWEQFWTTVERHTINAVRLRFAEAPNKVVTVVIQGISP